MTQTQLCRYCGEFYRMDDETIRKSPDTGTVSGASESIETDEGWVIDIGFRQCQTEFNFMERALSEAWQTYYKQLYQEE